MKTLTVLHGDCREILKTLPDSSVHCCVTSPPYFGLRSYAKDDHPDKAKEIGLEQTPAEFVASMVDVFREVRRVLRDDGTLWLNLGDSYNSLQFGAEKRQWREGAARADGQIRSDGMSRRNRDGTHAPGLKPKDLIGIPWRVAFALQADGWYLRQDIIWHKPNPMPESVTDLCTKAHEYIFLLSKSERYWFDSEAMKEPATTSERDIKRAKITGRGEQAASANYLGSPQRDKSGGFPQANTDNPVRNRRSVWTVATKPYKGAHFATFPPDLILPCVLAGCPVGGTVLDPFGGSGTTGKVAIENARKAVLVELYDHHLCQIENRTTTTLGLGI